MSPRYHKQFLQGLGILTEIQDIATIADAVLGWSKRRNAAKKRRKYQEALESMVNPPASPLPGTTPPGSWVIRGIYGQGITPANIRNPTEFQKQAIVAYQRALLPWFMEIIDTISTIDIPDSDKRKLMQAAEGYLRVWGIDPITYYQQLATQLGITPAEIAPNSQTAIVTTATNTSAGEQAATATITPTLTPTPVVVTPPPAPVQTYVPITQATPAAQSDTPASAQASATVSAPAPGIDWNKWAVPLAMIATTIIGAMLNKDQSGGDEHAAS